MVKGDRGAPMERLAGGNKLVTYLRNKVVTCRLCPSRRTASLTPDGHAVRRWSPRTRCGS